MYQLHDLFPEIDSLSIPEKIAENSLWTIKIRSLTSSSSEFMFTTTKSLIKLLLVCFPIALAAQDSYNTQSNDAFLRHYQEGEAFFNNKQFKKAIASFEKATKIKPDFSATYRRLGAAYELLDNFDRASEYYDECLSMDPKLSRTLYFQSGEMHLKKGNYELAFDRFKSLEAYLRLSPDAFTNGGLELDTERYFVSLLDKYIEDARFGMLSDNYKDINIENLGPAINSSVDDCFPYLSNDESWMFYTRMGQRKTIDENLLYSSKDKGMWSKGKPLGEVINSDVNEGMGKATRDERLMYFPACNREDILGVCDIFMAGMENGNILEVQQLKGQINSDRWDSQPSINCDGQALYFVSDREGGQGGTDIWVSYKMDNGTWGEAHNLGSTVNTSGDEEAPFIADDGVTLYFASNGHPGFGDQDIFFVKRKPDGNWGTPQNIGQPINSPFRELSFFINARGNRGYVSSNRDEGYGGLDIYKFDLPELKDFEEIAYVHGRVINEKTQQGIATKVHISGKGFYETDEDGSFFICFPTLSKLPVSVDQSGYYPYRKNHSLTDWEETGYVEVDIILNPLKEAALLKDVVTKIDVPKDVPITVQPTEIGHTDNEARQVYSTSDIYFYFDQYQLTSEAKYHLDRLAEEIDSDQLALIVVEGYADQTGSDDYNQRLSEKRAEEVATYFKAKGLKKLKVTYKGYGETRTSLINSKNRRVDIVVYYKL